MTVKDQEIIDKVTDRMYETSSYWAIKYIAGDWSFYYKILVRYARWIERAEQKRRFMHWLNLEYFRHQHQSLGHAIEEVLVHLMHHRDLT